MKIIIPAIAISLFISHSLLAQDPTPNAGFENWSEETCLNTFDVPDNWDQLNCATSILGVLTCLKTSDAHSGSLATKLITKEVNSPFGLDTANGIITTGELILIPPFGVKGGIPFHSRPDSIYGWFKYAPTADDSLQIEFDLFGPNHDTVGTALFQTGQTISTYTRFSTPIVYFTAETPDTSLWLISSSNGFKSLPNSTLYIDDVGIVYNTGIHTDALNNFISITPDPASDFIFIQNEKKLNCDFIFYDEEGRAMKKIRITNQLSSFSISDLPQGIYFIRLTDLKNNFITAGKILIQR